jgi:hypothetical protein
MRVRVDKCSKVATGLAKGNSCPQWGSVPVEDYWRKKLFEKLGYFCI